ncbi:ComEC/Rec2 family competence protein [Ectothiorhodospiraceae bacterium 2226]|nr:ComEC/Rec2 family competence protein [Ectothiorhodospiraceae bacterium 2226]
MRAAAFAFLLGVVLLQLMPGLPAPYWLLLALVLLPLAAWRPTRVPSAALAGFLWALLHAHLALADRLPPSLDGAVLSVEGQVAALPVQTSRGVHFLLDLTHAEPGSAALPSRLRVSWYGADTPVVRVGESWRMEVRLARPRSPVGASGFDHAGWMLREGIGGGATVVGMRAARVAAAEGYPVQRLRERLAVAQQEALAGHPAQGLVSALAIGERQAITAAQWDMLRRTGTSHLMAISGLHIGLVAALAFWLGRRGWPLWPGAASRLPAPYAGAGLAFFAALAYAALAGFAIPTQRALIMVVVALFGILAARRIGLSQTLALALLAVLLWDPFAVLSPGFWLSFAAVALIMYGLGNRPRARGLWWTWGRVQWVVGLGLLPLTLAWFNTGSLISPLANLLAVPWVSFVVVPLTLAGTATLLWLPAVGEALLALAAHSLTPLVWLLTQLASWSGAAWSPLAPPAWTLAAAAVGAAWLLAPRGVPARWLGVLWLLPLAALAGERPGVGEAWITAISNGQGTAVSVVTARHRLLYTGGAHDPALLERLGGGTPLRPDLYVHARGEAPNAAPAQHLAPADCATGRAWVWDEVRFSLLPHPGCVLLVEAGGRRLLLAEALTPAGQRELLHLGRSLRAEVLLAPRGRGRDLLNPLFIESVAARHVLIHDRLHPEVAARYQAQGGVFWPLARHGHVRVRLNGEPLLPEVRAPGRRYWHDAALSTDL